MTEQNELNQAHVKFHYTYILALRPREETVDYSSAERSRLASSGHAVALPKNLIVVPRADFTTATAQRYRSHFSSVHAKEKSRRELAA